MHSKENAAQPTPDPLRAPTLWADTDLGSLGSAAPGRGGQAAPRGSALTAQSLDVCHVGVVLRVVLGVQVVVWVAALYGTTSAMGWLYAAAAGAAQALPACLVWLLLVCGLKHWLHRQTSGVQWAVAGVLGALAAVLGHSQMAWLAWMLAGGAMPWGFWALAGPAATGLALAWLCLGWLHQRQARVLPQQTQARLAELQARIQPHFLFNTLNTAIALVQIDPMRAEAVLEDLAELFRRALNSPATPSTLADEVDLARRYLSIEQLRFGERLQVSWALDERVGSARVPTLLLQPLVENAVKHGVEASETGGWVKVHTWRQGGRVRVTVSNSLPTTPGRNTRAGHGMALRNVRQRLLLMHDVQAEFEAGPRAISPGSAEQCYMVQCAWPEDAA